MNSEQDPGWDLYPETVLELHLAEGLLRMDLRERVTPAVVARLVRLGPSASFAVITPDNPHGRERDAAGNVTGRAELARTLRERGVVHIRADGTSPDGAHREQGYAVWLDIEDARRLAREHGQSAFFWFDGAAFRIEGALVCAPARCLPLGG